MMRPVVLATTARLAVALVAISVFASHGQGAPAESPKPTGPQVTQRTFAGLLYIKHGRVGTRSEGPDYYLQTFRAEYLLKFKQKYLWAKDLALEPFSRKMVGVRGILEGETIHVAQIQEIKTPRIPVPPLEALVEGNGEFSFSLWQHLGGSNKPGTQPERNVAVSPHIISLALAMTYAGAEGATAAEMARTLRFTDVDPSLLPPTYADLMAVLHQNPRANYFTIHAANRLWAEKDFLPAILPRFREIHSQSYGAELSPVNFKSDAEGSRRTINHWVAEQTGRKIPELIPENGLDNLTRLVLTSALHFQGYWASPFDKLDTKPGKFQVTSKESVEVPFMQQRSVLPYIEEDYVQAVALPVKGDMYSMIFALPRDKQTLAMLRSRLSGRSFFHLTRRMAPRQVELHVPRFVVKSRFELGPTLSAMGMPQAFSAKDADFSGINGQKNLYIGKVFHEAFVDVNEAGLEAGAATAVVMKFKSLPPKATLLRMDRPFLFALRDNRTGSILFLGQVANPKP